MHGMSDAIVVAEIRKRMFDGVLQVGEPVSINDIADAIGTSTSPVRDALIQLTERGIISRVQGRGFFIAHVRTKEIIEVLNTLHQMLVFSSRQKDYTIRDSESKSSIINRIEASKSHDCINIIIDEICSPSLAQLAKSTADRLWVLRREINNSSSCAEIEKKFSIQIVEALFENNAQKLSGLIDLSYRFCRRYYLRRVAMN